MAATRRVLSIATKVGVVGGVLYLTTREGIWSDSQTGSTALKSMFKKSDSAVLWQETNFNFVRHWNNGVKTTFGGLASAPSWIASRASELADEGKKGISDLFKS